MRAIDDEGEMAGRFPIVDVDAIGRSEWADPTPMGS